MRLQHDTSCWCHESTLHSTDPLQQYLAMNPYARSRLIEFHEQPYTPPAIRQPVQDMLTIAWTHRVWPLQHTSPAVLAGQVLEQALSRIGDGEKVAVVDFCSGAGGPIPTIERVVK